MPCLMFIYFIPIYVTTSTLYVECFSIVKYVWSWGSGYMFAAMTNQELVDSGNQMMDETDQAILRGQKRLDYLWWWFCYEISLFILVSWKGISFIGYFEVWSWFPLTLIYFLIVALLFLIVVGVLAIIIVKVILFFHFLFR